MDCNLGTLLWAQTPEMKYCPTKELTMAVGGETDVNPLGIGNFFIYLFQQKNKDWAQIMISFWYGGMELILVSYFCEKFFCLQYSFQVHTYFFY